MDRGVLEDETGRRARWLRRAGRVVFVVFLGWLLVIVLGGLGLTPIAGIPLTHALRASPGPPPLVQRPTPRQPSPSDLRPAVSAKAYAAKVFAKAAHGRSSAAPGQTKTTTTPTVTTAHGKSTVAPGHTRTTTTPARGKSGTSHRHTTTTTTTTTVPTNHSKKP